LRPGRKNRNIPANTTPTPRERPDVAFSLAAVWPTALVGEIVRTVVMGPEPTGAILVGAKMQTDPEGSPPVQAKVMSESKPPVGFTVRVTASEFLP
jgi:hypothetical protein